MTATKQRITPSAGEELDLALRRLVLQGTVSNDQARAVHDAFALEVGELPNCPT